MPNTKSLVIVESPTKARTISRFLGSDFIVDSSFGHIRDLPASKLGVDTENNFEPQYVIPRKVSPLVKRLKTEAEKSAKVILATDEDREGEAIAWHLTQALKLDPGKIERIVFHEITKTAIQKALAHPRKIDIKRVDAQQARRILDRLVGYKLSPFLWSKIYRGLSAGRVQSVAVRFIVEREREIQQFKAEEYWSISALLQKPDDEKFEAYLVQKNGQPIQKFDIKNKAAAEEIVKDLENSSWTVANVERKAVNRNPLPPFTTSTLQQEAFRRSGFSAKQTMRIAQQLYEGIEIAEGPAGLITYMRTDSVNLSEESVQQASAFLRNEIGPSYSLSTPRKFATKTKGAQEAHEAIRPTDPARTPESVKAHLDRWQFKLYDLIWRRFMASQMPAAVFDATSVDITATLNPKPSTPTPSYIFRATGQIMKFDGFLKIYPLQFTEVTLPELSAEDNLNLIELKPEQHFTEPPPRYTEASLIKILEKNGIGRPSTYAPTLSTIQERRYVEKNEKRRLAPTEIGFMVNDLLVEHFPEIVDAEFTAKMEEELDDIAEGKAEWRPIIRGFYEPFAKRLAEKYAEVKKHEVEETTEEICEKCGKPMVVKLGRFGKFLACSGFPECKTTKPLKQEPETIGMKCPKCQEGDVVVKTTRRHRRFFGCSRYPACDYASWKDPRQTDATNTSDNK